MKLKKIMNTILSLGCILSILITFAGCSKPDEDLSPASDTAVSGETNVSAPSQTMPSEATASDSTAAAADSSEAAPSPLEGVAAETASKENTEAAQTSTAENSGAKDSAPSTSQNVKPENKKETQYPLTVVDDAGRKIVIKKKPEKLACISGTYLNTIYQIGGTAHIRSDSSGGGTIPEEAKKLLSVGNTVNVNVELLIANQPDLVICQKGLHDMLAAQLLAAKIPTVVLEMKGYEDVIHDVRLIGTIVDRQDAAEDCIKELKSKVNAIVSKVAKKKTKAVILYATSSDVSVKLDSSIAGDVAKLLGIENIASGSMPESVGADYTPFSLETIVAADPDVILVTTMVSSKEQAELRIRNDLQSNPGWNNLRAVKEGKIYYLPQSYFLYNPGIQYDLALKYMADLVYPEVK